MQDSYSLFMHEFINDTAEHELDKTIELDKDQLFELEKDEVSKYDTLSHHDERYRAFQHQIPPAAEPLDLDLENIDLDLESLSFGLTQMEGIEDLEMSGGSDLDNTDHLEIHSNHQNSYSALQPDYYTSLGDNENAKHNSPSVHSEHKSSINGGNNSFHGWDKEDPLIDLSGTHDQIRVPQSPTLPTSYQTQLQTNGWNDNSNVWTNTPTKYGHPLPPGDNLNLPNIQTDALQSLHAMLLSSQNECTSLRALNETLHATSAAQTEKIGISWNLPKNTLNQSDIKIA